ncbi:hypothetical protein [Treponema sp. R6D11]
MKIHKPNKLIIETTGIGEAIYENLAKIFGCNKIKRITRIRG